VPSFRIRVAISKGRKEIDLAQFAAINEELNSFLRSLGENAGLKEQDNIWRATKFRDGSCYYTGISPVSASLDAVTRCGLLAEAILSGDTAGARAVGAHEKTMFQFEKLAKKTRAGVPLEIGLFKSPSAKRAKWFPVTEEKATELMQGVEPYVSYEGSVHGVIHSFFKESDRPHFVLREVGRHDLVSCFYPTSLYSKISAALKKRDTLVYVKGTVRADRASRSIESVRVSDLVAAPDFSDADMDAVFGASPEITGNETSAEFIDRIRGERE
jgi:hypothetical protein